MSADTERIGALIRARRIDAGLSQEDLADMIGLTRTSVANAEAGRQEFPVMRLYATAVALGCELTSLLPPVSLPSRGPRSGQSGRCTGCGYLRTSPGHLAACGRVA